MADSGNDSGVTEIIERLVLLGVGAFALTKEKIQGTVEDLVKRGKLSKEEGKHLVDKLGKRGAKEKDAVAGFVEERTRKAIDMANLATKDEVLKLRAEVAALRNELSAAKRAAKPRT